MNSGRGEKQILARQVFFKQPETPLAMIRKLFFSNSKSQTGRSQKKRRINLRLVKDQGRIYQWPPRDHFFYPTTVTRKPHGEIRRRHRRERGTGRGRETHRSVKSMPRPKQNAQSSSILHRAEDRLSTAPPFPFIIIAASRAPAPPPPPGSWPPPNRRNQKKKKTLTTNKTKNKKLPPLARQGPNPRGDREEEQGGVRDWRWADRRRGRGEMRRRRKQLLVLLWFAWLRRLKQTKLWSAWWPPPCFCLSFFLTAFKNYYSLLTFQFPFPLFLFFFFCFCLSPFELCCW